MEIWQAVAVVEAPKRNIKFLGYVAHWVFGNETLCACVCRMRFACKFHLLIFKFWDSPPLIGFILDVINHL